MSTQPEYQDNARVTVGEIAEIAGVSSPAVSNWRRRHTDFPPPIEESPAGDLFEWGQVRAWLDKMGKSYDVSVSWEEVLWKIADHLRDQISVEEVVSAWLQLIYFRAAAERGMGDAECGGCWSTLSEAESPRDAWVGLTDHLDQNLAAVLQPPPRVAPGILSTMTKYVAGIPAGTDWGAIATRLLERYQESAGRAGDWFTPGAVSGLAIDLVGPITGPVLDPACGMAMTLAEAWRRRESDDVRLFGQEVIESVWRLGYLHLAILGASFELYCGDTLRHDRFRELRAKHVVLDPPMGMKPQLAGIRNDARWSAGVSEKNADWLWVQHCLYHMTEDGRAAVLLPSGGLFRGGKEREIRRAVVEEGALEAVIELPPGVLPGAGISPALLLFTLKAEPQGERVLFVDGKQLGTTRRGQLHELDEADVENITTAIRSYRQGNTVDEPRFAVSVPLEDVLADESILTPGRYVRYTTPVTEIDGEPLSERLDRQIGNLPGILVQVTNAVEALPGEIGAFELLPKPAEYPAVRLSDLLTAEPVTGSRQDVDGPGPAVPYVTTAQVSGRTHRLKRLPSEVTRGKTKDRFVSRGDVLLVSRGIETTRAIGCAVVDFEEKAAYSESLMRLSLDVARVDPAYLQLFLKSQQGKQALVAATTGSVISNLRRDALRNLGIPLPPMEIQEAAVAALDAARSHARDLTVAGSSVSEMLTTVKEALVSGFVAVDATSSHTETDAP